MLQLVGRLFGQTDPYAVLLVVFRRPEGDESQHDEGRYDQNLHVREVVERFEQRRAAVKDDVVMVVRPPELHRARRILLRQFVDHPAQTVGVVDDLVRNQVRPEHFQVLVGDDERDVVAVGDDVLNERVLHRAAHHVAVDPLHGVRPQRHVVLLLLLEPLGHVVGVEQRDHAEGYAHDDNHHAVAEREYVAADLHGCRVICAACPAR